MITTPIAASTEGYPAQTATAWKVAPIAALFAMMTYQPEPLDVDSL
jgi:hypothetical protein